MTLLPAISRQLQGHTTRAPIFLCIISNGVCVCVYASYDVRTGTRFAEWGDELNAACALVGY